MLEANRSEVGIDRQQFLDTEPLADGEHERVDVGEGKVAMRAQYLHRPVLILEDGLMNHHAAVLSPLQDCQRWSCLPATGDSGTDQGVCLSNHLPRGRKSAALPHASRTGGDSGIVMYIAGVQQADDRSRVEDGRSHA